MLLEGEGKGDSKGHRLVFSHFVPSVRRDGNSGGARWHDHDSIDN